MNVATARGDQQTLRALQLDLQLKWLREAGIEGRPNYRRPPRDDVVVSESLDPDGSTIRQISEHDAVIRMIEADGRLVYGDRIWQTWYFEASYFDERGVQRRVRFNAAFALQEHCGWQIETDAVYACCGAPVLWRSVGQAAPKRHRNCPHAGLVPEGHRRCTACDRVLPEDSEHFYFDRRRETFRTQCKVCMCASEGERRASRRKLREHISTDSSLEEDTNSTSRYESPLAMVAQFPVSPVVEEFRRLGAHAFAEVVEKWEAYLSEYRRERAEQIQQREQAKVQQRQLVEDRKRAHSGRKSRNPAYAYEYDPEWFEQYREKIRTVR